MAEANRYYARNNQQLGPVTLDALRGMVASGEIGATDLVWTQGMAQWLPARSVPEVSGAVPGGGGAGAGVPGGAMPSPYAPPPGAQPYPPGAYYGGPPPGAVDYSGKATTAMWLGISSLPLCLCPLVGIGLGIAAIVVGNKVPEGPDKGRAKTGVICGTIGVVIGILNAIAGVLIQFGQLGGGNFGN